MSSARADVKATQDYTTGNRERRVENKVEKRSKATSS